MDTTTKSRRRPRPIEFVPNGPPDQVRLARDAIASIEKPAIYYVGAKVIISWDEQIPAWSIRGAALILEEGDIRSGIQAELLRSLERAFRKHGLPLDMGEQR